MRARQQATTGRGSGSKKEGLDQAVGRSRGGLTTKVHMACDTLGRPVRFLIATGQSHDILAVPALLEGYRPAAVLAGIGAEAVIPSTRSRKDPDPARSPDLQAAQSRRAMLQQAQHFRRLATRFDRLARHYLAFVHIAVSILWMR